MPSDDLTQSMTARLEGTVSDFSPDRPEMISPVILRGMVLREFLDLLLDLAPPKEDALDALSKAIDVVFDKINRPVLASIIKPAVKSAILAAAERMYDAVIGDDETVEV